MRNDRIVGGDRIEISPAYDLWMMGARFGTVIKRRGMIVTVKMDHEIVLRPQHFHINNVRRLGDAWNDGGLTADEMMDDWS